MNCRGDGTLEYLLMDTYLNLILISLLLLLSHFSHVRLCVTSQRAAHQAPLSLGFSRQEHWSGFSALLAYIPPNSKQLRSILKKLGLEEVLKVRISASPQLLSKTQYYCDSRRHRQTRFRIQRLFGPNSQLNMQN